MTNEITIKQIQDETKAKSYGCTINDYRLFNEQTKKQEINNLVMIISMFVIGLFFGVLIGIGGL